MSTDSPSQTKIILHIDQSGSADPIPFGMDAPPYVVVRVQPIAGELSRYTVTSSDANDEREEDIVQSARLSERIVQTSTLIVPLHFPISSSLRWRP
jgi:protein ECT2